MENKINKIYPSPLRYPGGKQKQAKWIKNFFPNEINDYRELFLGGGSVAITLLRTKKIKSCILNDFDKSLYNFWVSAKNGNDDDYNIIKEYLILKSTTSADIFKEKKWPKISVLANENGIYYLLRNKMAFNGLKNFSKMAYERNFTESTLDRFKCLKNDLKNAGLFNKDYNNILKNVSRDTWIYADPPYLSASQNLYKDHSNFDHVKLASSLRYSRQLGANIVLSYDDSQEIRDLYKDWFISEYEWSYGMTNNKKNTNKTTKGKELIITSFDPKLLIK